MRNEADTPGMESSRKSSPTGPRTHKRTPFGAFAICVLAFGALDHLCAAETAGSNPMIHATYAVGNRLKNKAQIEKTRFAAFDVVYLVAGPGWEAEDFGGTKKVAMQRLVVEHTYPKGDEGEALVPMFIHRAHAASTRVVLSLPGHKKFRLISEVPARRRMFAEVMAAFVRKHHYDGIEIDWEGSDLRLDLHAELMKDLRTALDGQQMNGRPYTLTTALHSGHDVPESIAGDWCKALDWINLMTYDLGGGIWGRVATHNTPLPLIENNTVHNYESKGIPRSKLCIGLANYGFIYRGLKPGEKSSVSLGSKGKYFSHTQLAGLLADGWTEKYDEHAQAPYYFSPDGKDFVTMDNQRSLTEKVKWLKQTGYRGAFWWELHCDLVPAGEKARFNTHPLIDHVVLSVSKPTRAEELSWGELREMYQCPDWFAEARFGVWAHWGAQTEPEQGGGWYARHMYMQDVGDQTWGKNAYAYHLKRYGHPSEIGYKDVLNEWKAENLDTDALLEYFKSIGARYFMILANHHDRFDNFDSTHFAWNSVNVGPKRDIVGEFEKSTRKVGLRFGVSSHDDRFMHWWLPAFGADQDGPFKGIPYDGHMTRDDGVGKWWEGLDPAELYGLPPEKRTREWETRVKENWVLRHRELVTRYDVDMFWFDGHGFPYKEYGRQVCTDFYNFKLGKYGTLDAVIVGKCRNEPSTIQDVEQGGAEKIMAAPWQGTLTFNSWFYKQERPIKHDARTVIEMLIDMNSKNGNLLMNVELMPDGTIPPEHKKIMDEIGVWVNLHEEAIYASKPWKVYGDNLVSRLGVEHGAMREADLDALKKRKKTTHFNTRTLASAPFGHDEVRFVTNHGALYVFVMNPVAGEIKIPALGSGSPHLSKPVQDIHMVGSEAEVDYEQRHEALILEVPETRPGNYAAVFKVDGIL